jgi:hypothetical protein
MLEFEPGSDPYRNNAPRHELDFGRRPEIPQPELVEPNGIPPVASEQKETVEEEQTPDWRERSHFKELSPPLQDHYRTLIAEKLKDSGENINPEHAAVVTQIMCELAGRLHFNLLDQDEPGRASVVFDKIIQGIVLEPEDKTYDNGEQYIGGALNGRIHLFPKFFSETDDGRIKFDREHVLAHELGGLFRRYVKPDEYQQHKVPSEYALDGDYVNSFQETKDKQREEFEETFADFLRSTNSTGMLLRRFERYKDPVERDQLLADISENGSKKEHFRELLEESTQLRRFFQNRLANLAEVPDEESEDMYEEMQQMFEDEQMMSMPQAERMTGSPGNSDAWKNNPVIKFLEWLAN